MKLASPRLVLIVTLLFALPAWAGRSFAPLNATITAVSLTSNVATFTATNTFTSGLGVYISGLTGGCTNLNLQTVTVLSAGLSGSQFEANFTSANESCSGQSGIAASGGLIVANGISTPLDISSGPMTVFGWFYATTVDSSEHDIVAHWGGGSTTGASGAQFILGLGAYFQSGNTIGWNVGNGGIESGVYGACGTISANTWYPFTLFVDTAGKYGGSANAGLWVGSNQCSSQSYRETRTAGGANFTVGGTNAAANFKGVIGEIAVWNTILSPAQRTALLAGICAEGPSARRMGMPPPVGYFPLYGANSPEPDLSGNKDNGTVAGTSSANHPPCTP